MTQPWRGDGSKGDLPPWVTDVLGGHPHPQVPAPAPPPPPGTPPPYVAPPAPVPHYLQHGPPARPQRNGLYIGLGAAALALVVLATVGLVIGNVGRVLGGSPDASPSPTAPLAWAVGTCIRQVSGPTAYPTDLRPQDRNFYDLQRQYDTTKCDDKTAIGRITTMGAAYAKMDRKSITDDNCPADTDLMISVPDRYQLNYQTWCVRNLNPPHPGDPGGGAGKLVTGDCVTVYTSSGNYTVRNDLINEVACADPYYAKVLAITTDKAQCPADALSRLPRTVARTQTQPPAPILCLGQGGDGLIARPGECVRWPSNRFDLLARKPCDTNRLGTDRLVSLSDTKTGCPKTTRPHEGTGYDRFACLRYLHDEK